MKFCENARFSLYSYFMQKCGFDKKLGDDFCSVNSAGALTGLSHIFSFSIGYTWILRGRGRCRS